MTLLQYRRFLLLLLVVCALTVESATLKGQYGSVSRPNENRVLQKPDTNNNNNNEKNNKNKDESDREDEGTSESANIVVTTATPTQRPTEAPVEEVIDEALAAVDPSLEVDEDQPAVIVVIDENNNNNEDNDEPEESTATTTTEEDSSSVTLSMADLRDIQYTGSGTVTLRLSLWFQDGRQARDVESGSATNDAVLLAVQKLLCQLSDDDSSLGTTNTATATYDVNDAGDENDSIDTFLEAEERELCVIKTELTNPNLEQTMEGSILLQPPTTYVVDRSSLQDGLQWTTWRLTWNVLRLGTFYILQGLENAAPATLTSSTPTTTTDVMSHQDMYRAGVSAMEQVLDLALQVSVRENAFDPLLVESMAALSGSDNNNGDSGLVVASVYGEEEASLTPKLQFLGLTGSSTSGSVIEPTNFNTSVTPDGEDDDDDDEYDDDRYSLEYGITEQLDPVFWHPLRVVGMFLFALTTAALVALSCMSKKRQARRKAERIMAKESKGLLNNPQGVEDMLRASGRRDSKGGEDENDENDDDDDDDQDNDQDAAIPLPNNLKVSR